MSKSVWKSHFNTCISPLNKIWKYMSFTKDDKVLSDFIDYLSFYTTWSFGPLTKLLSSDNGPALYLWRLSVDLLDRKQWLFKAWVSTVFMGYSVKICQLNEIKIKDKIVLKIDIYWKWLKLLRDDYDLWLSLKLFFSDWLLLWDELTITRIDYTVDCAKINFRKENSLKCRVSGVYTKNWEVKTKYFWRKWHDTASFIRYYDKKEEMAVRWTTNLYPEYQFLPVVMRYELQVNSKGFDPYERCLKFDDLYNLINLWYHITDNNSSHKKQKDENLLNDTLSNINQLYYKKDFESLDKLYCYLDSIYRKNHRSLPIYMPLVWDSD